MPVDVIVLNGGSSVGKTTLAAELKRRLDGPWLSLGIDDLIRAVSHGPEDGTAGGTLTFGAGGAIGVAPAFRACRVAWFAGVAAAARAGIGVIADEVFLDGGRDQEELRRALAGLGVLWVGVRCDGSVAEARERSRGDRHAGLARDQADRVHEGVSYDLVVDTTATPAGVCAGQVMAAMARTLDPHGPPPA